MLSHEERNQGQAPAVETVQELAAPTLRSFASTNGTHRVCAECGRLQGEYDPYFSKGNGKWYCPVDFYKR